MPQITTCRIRSQGRHGGHSRAGLESKRALPSQDAIIADMNPTGRSTNTRIESESLTRGGSAGAAPRRRGASQDPGVCRHWGCDCPRGRPGAGGLRLLQPGTPTDRIRDIFVIFVSLETLVIGVALVVLLVQLASLINLLQNEVRPILKATSETVNTLRGTADFLGESVVEPVIKLNGYLASIRRVFRVNGRKTYLKRKGVVPMSSDSDEFGAFLVGFIVGGLTGAVVSLLFAPQSGEETRALIRDKSVELRDRASESAEEALSRAEAAAAEARARAEVWQGRLGRVRTNWPRGPDARRRPGERGAQQGRKRPGCGPQDDHEETGRRRQFSSPDR